MSYHVEKLRTRLLPEFDRIVNRIHESTTFVSAKIEDHKFGSGEFAGHSFIISLTLGNCLTEADNVALEVALIDLTSVPKINADVAWGHPSGSYEAEFSDAYLEISNEVLEDLYKDLPRLYEALFEALERRKPPDQ